MADRDMTPEDIEEFFCEAPAKQGMYAATRGSGVMRSMSEAELYTRHNAERIASLETTVDSIKEDQRELIEKVDDLLALKNKTMGAFWLVSAIIGTSIISVLSTIINWIRHGP